MTIEWNKVTWYSKLVAVIVFVGTFFLGFWLGTMKAEKIYMEVPHIVHHNNELTTQFLLNNSEVPEVKPEAVQDLTTATSSKVEWKTYTDTEHKFSISYPCVDRCPQSRNHFTTLHPSASIWFGVITDKDIKEMNDEAMLTSGHPLPIFPYSIKSIHDAFNLPIGQHCKILGSFTVADPEDTLTPADLIRQCLVVSLRGIKAVRFVAERELNGDGPTVQYFILQGPTLWLTFEEQYSTRADASFLIDPSKSTPELDKQVSAVAEVMNTLNFF